MLLPASACVLLVKLIVPRLGHCRPTPHMSPTVNFTARPNWDPLLDQIGSSSKEEQEQNWCHTQLTSIIRVCSWMPLCSQFWQFWRVDQQHLEEVEAKSGLVSCILYLVCAKLLRGIELPGRGVKLAWPTLSNFWITLTDTVENSNVTTDHWPANVHLFGIECFNTASSVLKTITLSAWDYLEIVILQLSEIPPEESVSF